MLKSILAAALAGLSLLLTPAIAQEAPQLPDPVAAETVPINGLDMYYEIHGDGPPLVLLHGAYMSIPSNWAMLLPVYAEKYKVIAVELQAHGRTSDAERPIRYETMADDVAALLDHLRIGKASVFGYSMGAGVAIRLAMQHPDKVDRLIAASGATTYDAYPDDFEAMIGSMTPETFAGSPMEEEYKRLSPNPDGFANLFEKLKDLDLQHYDWGDENFAKITAPTLLIFGDADVVELEHAVKLHQLLGGHMNGDMLGLPKVQLAVLPGTSHIGVMYNPINVEILKAIVPGFLARELPAPPMGF